MVIISNNYLNTQSLTARPGSSIESLLKIGQVLSANIQSINGNKVQLTLGNQTLVATSKTPILETGTVQVKVNQVKPELQLSIVSSDAKPSTTAANTQTIQAAYRQFIPLQAPLTQVFQQINLLQSLPPSVQASIQQLLDQISKPAQSLNGNTLKQRLADSGLFLESKLASGKSIEPASLNKDVKAQILQLQQQVSAIQQQANSASLTKLATLLDKALSRITVQQVQMLENPNITPLELPFERDRKTDNDLIEIRKNSLEEKEHWEAYIDLTLPQGLLSVKLKLSETGELDGFIWSETESLKEDVKTQLPLLEELLSANELTLKSLLLSENKPQKTENTTKMALIDIKI